MTSLPCLRAPDSFRLSSSLALSGSLMPWSLSTTTRRLLARLLRFSAKVPKKTSSTSLRHFLNCGGSSKIMTEKSWFWIWDTKLISLLSSGQRLRGQSKWWSLKETIVIQQNRSRLCGTRYSLTIAKSLVSYLSCPLIAMDSWSANKRSMLTISGTIHSHRKTG